MIDLQILGTFSRPGRWNWSFGTWFYRKLSRSPRDKKIKHVAKCIWRNFFKLAHYVYCFSEWNSISDIRPKHTDHCFQKKFNKIWSITIITRMPQWLNLAEFKFKKSLVWDTLLSIWNCHCHGWGMSELRMHTFHLPTCPCNTGVRYNSDTKIDTNSDTNNDTNSDTVHKTYHSHLLTCSREISVCILGIFLKWLLECIVYIVYFHAAHIRYHRHTL